MLPCIIIWKLIIETYSTCDPLTFIVLGFYATSALVGHFVSPPGERMKKDRRVGRGDEREGQGKKRKINGSEETEEIKTFTLYPYLLQG